MKAQKTLRTFLWCWYDNFTSSIFAMVYLIVCIVLFFQIDPDGRTNFLSICIPVVLWFYYSAQQYRLDTLNSKMANQWIELKDLEDQQVKWMDNLIDLRYSFHEDKQDLGIGEQLPADSMEEYRVLFLENIKNRTLIKDRMQYCYNTVWTLKVIRSIVTGKWKRSTNVKKISIPAKGYTFIEILRTLNRPR